MSRIDNTAIRPSRKPHGHATYAERRAMENLIMSNYRLEPDDGSGETTYALSTGWTWERVAKTVAPHLTGVQARKVAADIGMSFARRQSPTNDGKAIVVRLQQQVTELTERVRMLELTCRRAFAASAGSSNQPREGEAHDAY